MQWEYKLYQHKQGTSSSVAIWKCETGKKRKSFLFKVAIPSLFVTMAIQEWSNYGISQACTAESTRHCGYNRVLAFYRENKYSTYFLHIFLHECMSVKVTYSQVFPNRQIQQYYEKFYNGPYFIRISFFPFSFSFSILFYFILWSCRKNGMSWEQKELFEVK